MTRRAMAMTGVILGVVAVALVALVGVWLLRGGESGETRGGAEIFVVRRGNFDVTVPTSGELAALNQIEIKNELEVRAVIMELALEGTRVKAGDLLIRFNDDSIREKIKDAEEDVTSARNSVETAQADLSIRRKKSESEVAAAELRVRLAELGLKSWEEGALVTKRQELDLRVKTSEKEYERAMARFEAAERLLEKEFISQDDFMKDEIELIKSISALETARLDQEVYEKYDVVRDREEKESDLQQALDELDRTRERVTAEMASAKSDLEASERRLASKEERLEKYTRQLDYCTIYAPSDGLVVYNSSLDSGGGHRSRSNDPPTVGTEVSRNETIIVLPDVSQMVAAVKVNEAQSGMIQRGQRANVRCDALPEVPLSGAVLSVGVLAESGSWRDPNRRDYTVRILLEDTEDLGLKPSMKCRAQIGVDQVNESVYVPIQSAFRKGRTAFVYVEVPGGYAQRPVQLGRASELYVEILDGVSEGDRVLLREPAAPEIVDRIEDQRRGDQLAMSTPADDTGEAHPRIERR